MSCMSATQKYSSAVFFICISCLALLIAGCKTSGKKNENADIALYGTIDIREVQLAFQDGGKIKAVSVEEGAKVSKGQPLATLDPERFALDVERLKAEVMAQQQNVLRLREGNRSQEIERAKAMVVEAQAAAQDADIVYARKKSLLISNRIAQQEVDSARSKMEASQAALQAAKETLSLTVEGPRKEDIEAAEASLAASKAALALAEQRLNDTQLLAPATGVIRNRLLEPGAMAGTGAPVLTLALTEPLWVRAYIDEVDLARIKVGMPAEIQNDTFPDKRYRGWVGFISSTAEFTPKTVETTELRTKLVYQARIFVCNQNDELRLGMPVTVNLSANGQAVPGSAVPCSP